MEGIHIRKGQVIEKLLRNLEIILLQVALSDHCELERNEFPKHPQSFLL